MEMTVYRKTKYCLFKPFCNSRTLCASLFINKRLTKTRKNFVTSTEGYIRNVLDMFTNYTLPEHSNIDYTEMMA